MIAVVDRRPLDEFVFEMRRASRLGREERVRNGEVVVDPTVARWRRLHVSHAVERLPATAIADGAWGGLQDSAPRAALVGLLARVDGVDRDSWEHPDLVQIWFRWADYLVPRADVGVFTLGAMPRRRSWADALEALADAVIDAMDGERSVRRVVSTRLPALPIRSACVSGRVHIRWDTRNVDVIVADRPEIDPEPARLELARRFLRWHGPAGPRHLARWAGLTREDAQETWAELGPELAPVELAGRQRWLLRDDVDAAISAPRPVGVRLLPPGDPVLHVPDPTPVRPPRVRPRPEDGITSRLVNSLTGRVVVDGEVVGSWGRVKGAVTVVPWSDVPRARRGPIEDEARAMARTVDFPFSFRVIAT
jgi:hypothetical protein